MIHVDSLCKTYHVPKKRPGLTGSLVSLFSRDVQLVRAVRNITFDIQPGERVGFLGPNGAGKTTTLKMLSGLLVPTSGRVEVAGFQPSNRDPDFLRRITLVMGQKQQLLWDLPPLDSFELNRALYAIPRAKYLETLGRLRDLLDLGGLLGRPTRNLSLGERMKCELAVALLHHPDLLFMDEPTIGLDVTMQTTVRSFIAEWNQLYGVTVLLTSHYMQDIAALCKRVIVIDGGQLVYDGDLGALARSVAPYRRILLRSHSDINIDVLRSFGPFVREHGSVFAAVDAANVNSIVNRLLVELPDIELSVEDASLESIIAQLFRRESGAKATA